MAERVLTSYEEAAIAYIAKKTKTHDDAVTRFYQNRNSELIYIENRYIGKLVEEVALAMQLKEALENYGEDSEQTRAALEAARKAGL